jgi:hypothetical protein
VVVSPARSHELPAGTTLAIDSPISPWISFTASAQRCATGRRGGTFGRHHREARPTAPPARGGWSQRRR